MYNTPLPTQAELPTTARLLRSTIIALISAIIILVAFILPSEYGIDPTGIGKKLGLTEMGQIKVQLAAEAEAEAAAEANETIKPTPEPTPESAPAPTTALTAEDKPEPKPATAPQAAPPAPAPAPAPAQAQDTQMATAAATVSAPVSATTNQEKPVDTAVKTDEVSFTLKPGQGAEFKLVMKSGAKANYSWTANGAVVNFDTHGDGGGRSITYEKGRGVPSDEGILEAAFEGNHGWFWRNRTKSDVTVTLKTSGDYIELKRLI